MTEFIKDPAAFNAKAHAEATRRVHTNEPGHFKVTRETFPTLHAVFEDISHDSGGSAGHESYSVPDSRRVHAERCEAVLSKLSEADRRTLAYGDQDEAQEILKLNCRDAEESDMVDDFLNGFFEDWSLDTGQTEKSNG